jgi:hypothetical protein
MDITLLLSTSIISECYFVGIYFNAFHDWSCLHLCYICSIDRCPDDQEDVSSWDTWYFHQDITYECICAFYATADADEEEIILREKGTGESGYDNGFGDGDD